MRAADLPERLPQAPSGRRSAALQLLLVDCTARVNSVPPKESALAFKTCERIPPPKLPLATIAEHDPIYPLSNPSCSEFSFSNDRASKVLMVSTAKTFAKSRRFQHAGPISNSKTGIIAPLALGFAYISNTGWAINRTIIAR